MKTGVAGANAAASLYVPTGDERMELPEAERQSVDLRELFRGCRAVLMPGIEDFGIVPLEAMACGRPAVVFGEGGGAETVEHGRSGLTQQCHRDVNRTPPIVLVIVVMLLKQGCGKVQPPGESAAPSRQCLGGGGDARRSSLVNAAWQLRFSAGGGGWQA